MKKFVSGMLAFMLCLALAACGSAPAGGSGDDANANAGGDTPEVETPSTDEPTPYQQYLEASEAMADATSLSMDFESIIAMSVEGTSIEVAVTALIDEVIESPTSIQLYMDMTTKVLGQDVQTKAWYRDGVYYMDTNGQKMKTTMDATAALDQANTKPVEFPESAIKDQEEVEAANGGKELHITIDAKVARDLTKDAVNQLNSLYADATVTVSDITLVATLDAEGALTGLDMVFDMEANTDGQALTANYRMAMTNIALNNTTVTFPDDLDSYLEAGSIAS